MRRVPLLMMVLMVVAAPIGCDRLLGGSGEGGPVDKGEPAEVDPKRPSAVEPEPDAPSPAAADPGAPAVDSDKPPIADAPDSPAPVPEAAVSEFDALLVRLSEQPSPAGVESPTVAEDGATAWKHYKAKEYPAAARHFARVAARDAAWKHAHNMGCALAMAGKPDDVRIALAESIRRGGADAIALARKDSDLAAVRTLDWFEPLLANPSPSTIADATVPDEDEEPLPANCPPGVTWDDEHYCVIDVVAPFTFEDVVFDRPITLELEPPTRPAKERWKLAKGKILTNQLRTELGIQHTTETLELSNAPHIMGEGDGPLEDGMESKPFFWWPEDSTPILVIPHKQKLGKMRINAVILARKTDAGWRATNLEVVVASKHEGHGGSAVLESGIGFRFDGLELFTLAQVTDENDRFFPHPSIGSPRPTPAEPTDRHLCRIRWEQGRLARACVDAWTENSYL
jgi:hypothetical protein